MHSGRRKSRYTLALKSRHSLKLSSLMARSSIIGLSPCVCFTTYFSYHFINLSVQFLIRLIVENEDFVDPVTYSLAEAWVYYQDTRPFAIYSDDTIVGFVSMYVGEDNYQIINFLIDDAFQRKGYGSKAVKLCIEYLQREFSACRISAPVKMEHIAAQEFWIKQGFCLSDTIEDGYVFMRLYLI